MKTQKTNYRKPAFRVKLLSLLLIALVFTQCNTQVQEWKPKSDQLVITEYVYDNPELYTEFGNVLRVTGVENLLRVRGPFTLLLPTDEAMKAYYASMNVTSYDQIDVETLKDFAYNHIFSGEYSAGVIGMGAMPSKNALGDYVATDLPGIDILINKEAKITKRDIHVSNGYIHQIDHVIDVVTKSVYEVLKDDPGYSIFTQGLEKTGISDTLSVIDFQYGTSTARNRYTILAVPDTLYNRFGINSIDDLVAKYSNGSDLKDPNNSFNQYMVFHCLSGTHYFTDFQPDNVYYIISEENYLNIKVENDFEINKSDSGYTGFYFDQSNVPAKNGVIHTVNSLLPNEDAAPAEIVFQTTDYFDFQQEPCYGHYYQRFFDGANTFKYIKWDAEYLEYYFKNEDLFMDADGISLNGHFWIEITTPKIRAGKYMLGTYWFGGAVTAWYIDGKYISDIDLANLTWNNWMDVGEVDFTETSNHVIKVKTLVPGQIFWDRVRFTPM